MTQTSLVPSTHRIFTRVAPCAVAFLFTAAACDPGAEADDAEIEDEEIDGDTEEDDDGAFRGGEGIDQTDRSKLPVEAQAAMQAAEAAKRAPQFFLCPYYLSYEVIGFTELGDNTPEWFGAAAALFTANLPSWFATGGGGVGLLCGTTESAEPFMQARRFVPNVSSCVTSAPGQPAPWFVCS
jgi:hypothetical protein